MKKKMLLTNSVLIGFQVLINVPTKTQRRDILLSHLSDLHLITSHLDLDYLANVTNGYVGADLAALCHEAAYIAMNVQKGNQDQECKVIFCCLSKFLDTLKIWFCYTKIGIVNA